MQDRNSRLPDRTLAVVSGLIGFAVCAALVYPIRHWPVDDGMIHLRIVRNLLEHGTLSFNVTPTGLSTTSPVWNYLCAAVAWVVRVEPTDARALVAVGQTVATGFVGVACAAAALLLRPAGWLAVVVGVGLIATDPYLGYSAASAMEMPLYVALVLWILLLERRSGPGRLRWVVGFLLAAGIQIRPEATTLVGGILLFRMFPARRPWRGVLVDALVIAIFVGAWASVVYLDVHEVVPRSLLAKSTGHEAAGWATGSTRQVMRYLVQAYAPALAVAALSWLGRRRTLPRAELALATWIWVVPLLGYLAFLREPVVSSRYMCVLLPGIALTVAWSLAGAGLSRSRLRWATGVLLVVASTGGSVAAMAPRNARGEALEPERIAVGRWIARETRPDARVYAHALGYIGFYCERYCVGGAGLVDESSRGHRLRDGSLDWESYLEDLDIDYYVSRGDPPVPAEPVFTAPVGTRAQPLQVWRRLDRSR